MQTNEHSFDNNHGNKSNISPVHKSHVHRAQAIQMHAQGHRPTRPHATRHNTSHPNQRRALAFDAEEASEPEPVDVCAACGAAVRRHHLLTSVRRAGLQARDIICRHPCVVRVCEPATDRCWWCRGGKEGGTTLVVVSSTCGWNG
jgi:hypothetical protein